MDNTNDIFSRIGIQKKIVPLVLQAEVTECGLACVSMIASFHGYKSDLASLRSIFPVSTKGTTLKKIINIAHAIGLNSRAIKVDLDEFSLLNVPCILHWNLDHFVVLTQVKDSHIFLHDPAIGKIKLSLSEASECFTGVALELQPSKKFIPKSQKSPLKLWDFWDYSKGLKESLTLVFIFSIALQILVLTLPFLLQIVVDDVVLNSDRNLLEILALGFSLLIVIDTAIGYVRSLALINFSSRFSLQIESNVFRHLISLPMSYFVKRDLGDIVSRFRSLRSIRDIFTNRIVSSLVDGLLALFSLVALFLYSFELSILVLLFSISYFFLRLFLYNKEQRLSAEELVVTAKEDTHFMESIRAIQTIKIFGKETDRISQWSNRIVDSLNKNIAVNVLSARADSANKFLFNIENIVIIYCATLLVLDDLMTVGMLLAFMAYKSRFIQSVNELIKAFMEFKLIGVHLNRLADIVFTNPESVLASTPHSETRHNVSGSNEIAIALDRVGFSYDGDVDEVFSDINLKIAVGESLAITGRSGAGKTTLLTCMMGLQKSTKGVISHYGSDIKTSTSYRDRIAAVMQDDKLLAGTIADNIAFFVQPIDMPLVIECARVACVHDDIEEMPMSYRSTVGDMGDALSGGEKQRIILARALYQKPDIIFLDEATSHLDSCTEKLVNENLSSLKITRILVAHRKDTIMSADKVFDLDAKSLRIISAPKTVPEV